jgi:nitrite reductase/ring-hydroxylating ferredoxin subunit
MLFERKIVWYKLYETLEAAHMQLKMGVIVSKQLGKKQVCIVRTNEGIFALEDKCPHNGAALSKGYCTEQGSIVCPVHRYHFDLKTGRAKSGIGDVAITFPIKSDQTGVYIGIKESVWNIF